MRQPETWMNAGSTTSPHLRSTSELSRRGRLGYYRNPIVMFGIGPPWLFLIKKRLPFGVLRSDYLPWASTMATNLAIAILVGAMIWITGLTPILTVHLPIVLMAGAAGVWLFYVQHQFEETHGSKKPDWQFQTAALHGASHYDLSFPLRWRKMKAATLSWVLS